MVSFLYFDRKYITNSSGGRGMTKTVQRETINYLPFINVTGTSHVAWKSSQLCYLTQTVLSFLFFSCLPPAELFIFYFRLQRKKTLEFDPRIEKTINYAPSTQKMEKNKFIEAKVNLFVICSNMYFEFNLFNIYANLHNFIQKAYSRI